MSGSYLLALVTADFKLSETIARGTPPKKDKALQKIESHEKQCRIMQKQTHDKIHSIETQIQRIESILLITSGALISGLVYVIFTLITK